MIASINNPMPPLWLQYPHISRYSIGWRMGYGESYVFEFNEWFNALSENQKQAYQILFPEPREWCGYYDDRDEYHDDSILLSAYEDMRFTKDWLIEKYNKEQNTEFWSSIIIVTI